MQDHKTTLTYEMPLYRRPSEKLVAFMGEMHNTTVPAFAKYWGGKFSLYRTDTDTVTFRPIPRHIATVKEQSSKLLTVISAFASKLNATSAMVAKADAKVEIDFVEADAVQDLNPDYGTGVVCIMRVTVICENMATRMVLSNFFEMLDSCGKD